MAPPRDLAIVTLAVQEVFPEYFSPDCCINGTRVVIDALRQLKLNAYPLSVDVLAMNARWAELVEQNQGWPKGRAESDQWQEMGGYCIGVGPKSPHNPLKWSGHLVAHCRGYILDSSLGQMKRPKWNIMLPDVALLECPLGFLDGKAQLAVQREQSGTRLFYNALPDDKSFVDIEGFQRSDVNEEVLQAVMRRVIRLKRGK